MSLPKTKKRKKNLKELGSDNIDSTGPVKKILDEIQHKNGKAYKFYCQVLGKRPATVCGDHCTLVGHPVSSFPEDWDGDLGGEYCEEFCYKSSHPKMITAFKNRDVADPLTGYMLAKREWAQKLSALSCKTEGVVNEFKPLNKEVVKCPKHIITMAAHYERNPDPYFDSSYNWYYAGHGNMHVLTVDHIRYLAHSELNCLYLTRISDDMKLESQSSCSFKCEDEINILETICSDKIVALRTKHKVFLLKLHCDDNVNLEKVKEIESKLPYTSIAFDPYHSILYVTSLDNNVNIINLDNLLTKSVKLTEKVKLLNNWSSVQGYDRVHYVHATNRQINVFDKRSHSIAYTVNAHKNVSDRCNELTSLRNLNDSPYIYIGTSHHLICLDIRSQQKSKPKVLQRWTHGMQCAPLYISSCGFESGKELICLSSQWCEDTCVIVSSAGGFEAGLLPETVVIPYRPPSILNTLHQARLRKLCLNLYSPIDVQLSTSITGTLLFENDEKYTILVQNALGDITEQSLYPAHLQKFMDDESFEHLELWAKKPSVEPKKIEVTAVCNIAPFLFEPLILSKETRFSYSESKDPKFSEDAVVDLINAESFDQGLLEAWGLDIGKENTQNGETFNLSLEE